MSPLRRLAACLTLLLVVACATRPPAEPVREPSALAKLFEQPLERRGAAMEAFVRSARPRVLVEVVAREPIEAAYGSLLPIGLEDFDILRIVVLQDDPAVFLDPGVAIVPEARPAEGLPMFATDRDLLIAFTQERPAGTHTRYKLKAAGLPWFVNVLTVGVLEVASLHFEGEEIQPDEEDMARAAPRATLLATLLDSPHGCGRRRSPCDRILVVPRQRDDVALRLELELELDDGVGAGLRLTSSVPLPAGKPLAARLAEVFRGGPIELTGASIDPLWEPRSMQTGCRLKDRVCAAPTAAKVARPEPPAVIAPERLATPAESLAARPQWVRDEGYAPATSIERFGPADLVAGGPLREVLLVCDLELPAVIDVHTLVVEARVGALPVHHPDVFSQPDVPARFVVPLVQLDPDESVAVTVSIRKSSWFWGIDDVLYGRAKGVYRGVLPLVVGGRGIPMSCSALGREGVEKQVVSRMVSLANQLASFDIGVDPIDERSHDWGARNWGMSNLQDRVETIAGLVGWSDPRIRALLPALEHYRDVFARHLRRFLAARSAAAPAPGTQLSFADGDLRIVGEVCGAAIDRRRILWSREKVAKDGCVTILEVTAREGLPIEFSSRTGQLGSIWHADLAWEDGRRSDAWTVGVELMAAGKRRDVERVSLRPGESARIYLAPEEPFHREGGPGPLLLVALDKLDTVFIRLR